MSRNNIFDDPDINTTTRLYENTFNYGIMPTPDTTGKFKYKDKYVRDSCLYNKHFEVNHKKKQNDFKNQTYNLKPETKDPSSSTISEGKLFNDNKEEKVFITTILS